MGLSADEFVKCLADSGLVAPEAVQELKHRLLNNDSLREAASLALALVRENLLTEYQATVLLQGDSTGLVLGNYTILDKIGQGGMGRVFKAWHRRMKRVVALKTLPPELTKDEKAIQRFRREVETAAQLSHRNIVTAFDADEVSGVHFLVMEYVEGANLSQLVKSHGPFSVYDGVRCILDAAHGLNFAHQQGIVHRDIKPANLLLDAKGMVKVLDMGLARTQEFATANSSNSPAELTSEHTVVGTADYLAPEQAVYPKRADHRVDIYSLGVSLYYILTGKIPYPGDSVFERLVAHRERPIPQLGGECHDVPLVVERIFQKMLAKSPDDRYLSMGELIRELEDCLRIISPSVSAGEPIRPGKSLDPATASVQQPALSLAETMPLHRFRSSWRNALFFIGATAVALTLWMAWQYRGTGNQISGKSNPTVKSTAPSFASVFPDAPKFVDPSFDVVEARHRQQAWSKYLRIQKETTSSSGIRLTLIPPGGFLMGSTDVEIRSLTEEANANRLPQWYVDLVPSEGPRHQAQVEFPFLMGVYEITREQFERGGKQRGEAAEVKAQSGNSFIDTDSHSTPADSITWYEAVQFCNRLSESEGFSPCYTIHGTNVSRLVGSGYRLPTESEWEYACRAGSTSRWCFGDEPSTLKEFGWYDVSGAKSATEVGKLQPNPWGVYDLYGNVWEWCEDAFDENAYRDSTRPLSDATKGRVVRGGSFAWPADVCRSANRTYYVPSYGDGKNTHGLRVIREIHSKSL